MYNMLSRLVSLFRFWVCFLGAACLILFGTIVAPSAYTGVGGIILVILTLFLDFIFAFSLLLSLSLLDCTEMEIGVSSFWGTRF